jgi:hypothetical protein
MASNTALRDSERARTEIEERTGMLAEIAETTGIAPGDDLYDDVAARLAEIQQSVATAINRAAH